MAGAAVTEDVVDPVHSPGHRVAWLVFVNGGQELSLLPVPVEGRGLVTGNLQADMPSRHWPLKQII